MFIFLIKLKKSRRKSSRYIALMPVVDYKLLENYLLRGFGELEFGKAAIKPIFFKGKNFFVLKISRDYFRKALALLSLTDKETHGFRLYPIISSGTLKALKKKLKERGFL